MPKLIAQESRSLMESAFYYLILSASSIAGGIVSAGMAKDTTTSYTFKLIVSSLTGMSVTLILKSSFLQDWNAYAFLPIATAISMVGWHLAKGWDALGQKFEDDPVGIVDILRRKNPPNNGTK